MKYLEVNCFVMNDGNDFGGEDGSLGEVYVEGYFELI